MGFLNQIRDFFDNHILVFNLLAVIIISFLISKTYDKALVKIRSGESFRNKIIIYEILECLFIFVTYSLLIAGFTNRRLPNLKEFALMVLVSLCLDRARIKGKYKYENPPTRHSDEHSEEESHKQGNHFNRIFTMRRLRPSFLFEGGRLGINIKRKKKGKTMARNLSNKEKRIYLGFLIGMWILIMLSVYTMKVYKIWHFFVIFLIWSLIFVLYQRYLGIRVDKKIGTYLGDLPKKDTYRYYIAGFLNILAINFAISLDIKFIVLVGLASAFMFYESYKMIENAY